MAQWELNDGAGQVGPLEEDHVIRMLQHGIPEHTVVRMVGEAEWRSPRTHAPFAIVLNRKTASLAVVAPSPPEPIAEAAPESPRVVYVERRQPERSAGVSLVRVLGGLIFVGGLVGMIPGCLLGGPVGFLVVFVVMIFGWMMTRAEG